MVRGAQLGALVLIVAAVYALVVLGIGGVPTSRQSTLLGFSALAAAVAAVLYAGVRERVAVRARLVVDPMGSERDVVRMFSRRVAADLPVDELLPVLIESLGSGLRLSKILFP